MGWVYNVQYLFSIFEKRNPAYQGPHGSNHGSEGIGWPSAEQSLQC